MLDGRERGGWWFNYATAGAAPPTSAVCVLCVCGCKGAGGGKELGWAGLGRADDLTIISDVLEPYLWTVGGKLSGG